MRYFCRNLHIESNLWNAIQSEGSELLGTVKDSALLDGYLTLDDLKRIQAALDFLLLSFPPNAKHRKYSAQRF